MVNNVLILENNELYRVNATPLAWHIWVRYQPTFTNALSDSPLLYISKPRFRIKSFHAS